MHEACPWYAALARTCLVLLNPHASAACGTGARRGRLSPVFGWNVLCMGATLTETLVLDVLGVSHSVLGVLLG